ncbi:hypothetical protein PTTG_26038 [Puccinia triticina 1-1 BBBD Race 1]|uniref:Uncharacterized protein n=2 Tax=Puccinia triticina TaxID=208348 RepID=A0A180GZE0_PUCT1|nr:uncharacterized protein PtA15_9A676 [Puccinia triticina]OAV97383.1 hypothetical protein PTTG_26038 [Puccinia triticina 1-1 BBBD Race 1]WAQ88549.1 hypothetical protein PtA15_9A676 [Puccinia triticina]WAR60726.1 hypothetical protein PtB15_9B665 [Puccinia triticina]
MNSTYFLRGILLLAHLFHDRASAAYRTQEYGEIAEIGRVDSIESVHAPLLMKSVQEPSSHRKGRLSSIHQKIKGLRTSSQENGPIEVDKELRVWLDKIYKPDGGIELFLISGRAGTPFRRIQRPESFKVYATEIEPVRKLIEQFKADPESPYMRNLVHDVMWEIFTMTGKNDEELAKIATCAKALADVTNAKQSDINKLTEFEKVNRESFTFHLKPWTAHRKSVNKKASLLLHYLAQMLSGGLPSIPWEINWNIIRGIKGPKTRSAENDPVKVAKELKVWLDSIYNPEGGIELFLITGQAGNPLKRIQPPKSFTAHATAIEPVRKLMEQFTADPKDESIQNLVHDVMWEIFRMSGKNDEELAKIATCAKALADVSKAGQSDINKLAEFEQANRHHLTTHFQFISPWTSYLCPPVNRQVWNLLRSLEIMLTGGYH